MSELSMNPRAKTGFSNRQRGASSLFVTVILVMVVMLLAVTASVLSNTQFRLAGNLQFENVAFNLAEGAIATGESWLSTGTNASDGGLITRATATPELYPTAGLDPLAMTWGNTNSKAVGGDDNQRYLVEKAMADSMQDGESIATCGDRSGAIRESVDVFLVSAVGKSVRGTTKAIQTTYSVKKNC